MSKIEQLVESISGISGITKLVIASRDGTILSKQGVKGDQFGNLVLFVGVSTEQMRTLMGFNGPNYVVMSQSGGEKIIVLSGPKLILGLEIGSTISPTMIIDSIKPVLNRISTT